jgi:hypothetical protein
MDANQSMISVHFRSFPAVLVFSVLAIELSAAPIDRLPAAARTSVLPAEEIAVIAADSQRAGMHYRWLTLGHLPRDAQAETIVAVNYALNAVSRVRTITPAVQVSPTVLRIDVSAYCQGENQIDAWELAWGEVAKRDFYHHLMTQVLVGSHSTGSGQAKVETVSVAGGWLDPLVEARIRAATATPQFGAVLRADYFVAAALKAPDYYRFSGAAETLDGWLKQFGADAKLAEQLEASNGANLFVSGVTLKPRRVIWQQGILGGVYSTLDSREADAAHDPFYRPISADGSQVKFDAQELFAMRANGFWATFIADAAGKRLDVVDPQIVSRDYAIAELGAADTQIYAGRNCLVCHSTGGLNAFSDDQAKLLRTTRARAELSSYNGAYVRRVLSFYDDERLQRQMKIDRESHELAIKRACGTTPEKAVAAVGATIKRAEFDPVAPQTAADELQCSVDELPDIIDGTHDPNLAGLLEGRAITRPAWQSAYAEAAMKRANWRKP